MARQDSDHLWGFGLRRTSARLGSEIEPKCLILISNIELMLKPAATAGFSSTIPGQKHFLHLCKRIEFSDLSENRVNWRQIFKKLTRKLMWVFCVSRPNETFPSLFTILLYSCTRPLWSSTLCHWVSTLLYK